MTKPFTNTVAGRKRVIRVCDVVRTRMGLGSLPHEYDFDPKKDGALIAGAWINSYGWEVRVVFHPPFFDLSFERQVHTIIHEHVHSSLVPLLQVVQGSTYYKKNHQFRLDVYRADEIATDHLVVPWLHYMRPEIMKAAA